MAEPRELGAEKLIYLCLGSNLGDREVNLRRALGELEQAGIHVQRSSSLYETEPVCRYPQPWFLNVVVAAETSLMPVQLLRRLQQIERELGRRRNIVGGPRTIDIDILLYDRAVVRSTELLIPHPRMAERRFVLRPLSEIAPGLRHPLSRKTALELLAETPDRSQVRLFQAPGCAAPSG